MKKQDTRNKKQDTRNKKQEARSKKQETRNKKQETRSKKQEARSKKQEASKKEKKKDGIGKGGWKSLEENWDLEVRVDERSELRLSGLRAERKVRKKNKKISIYTFSLFICLFLDFIWKNRKYKKLLFYVFTYKKGLSKIHIRIVMHEEKCREK